MESLYSAVVLSRGGTWKPRPDETPYLLPSNNRLVVWPEGATAECKFYGTDGTELATVDGEVLPDRIEFIGDPEEMDRIPAGAGFTITMETDDGVFPIRHGKVIRKQLEFTTPLAQLDIPPLAINDNLQRTALGRKWIPQFGQLRLIDNSDAGLPIGVGAQGQDGAMRYVQEFTTPSIEIGVTLLNRAPNVPAWTSLNFGADINAEMGFAVKFETGSSGARRVHIGTLSNPMSVIDRTPTVANEVATIDSYVIRFLHASKTVAVYKGVSREPMIQWPDENDIVPRGIGYRHLGASFHRSSTSSTHGIQLAGISARDAA
ncbi:MAG: hypothetical protein PGN30_10145 [Mycolicibacterium neoaurum]|uniref:LtfC-like domain-containing protein n=1 Tax=Mycolicibacterium neoaurum TaxID=1795 RepID=UPI002FF4D8B8